MSDFKVWRIVPLKMVTTMEEERDKWIKAGHDLVELVSIERVQELESQLEQAKKDISQVAKHYEEGTIFYERNYEAFYTDSFQTLMCEIQKNHVAKDIQK